MRLVKPNHEILQIMGMDSSPLYLIEAAGRTCYKSEDKITQDSAEKFIKSIRDRGHHSVLEHSAMTVRFICDRGVTHEIVRHRLAAYSQESTRYCNYKGGVTFVIPPWVDLPEGEVIQLQPDYTQHCPLELITASIEDTPRGIWLRSMASAEVDYSLLLNEGWSPQQARSVLPNSLKTEIVMTANFREWRHVFTLRCSKAAHPQMRELMIPLLIKCQGIIPVIFDDIQGL